MMMMATTTVIMMTKMFGQENKWSVTQMVCQADGHGPQFHMQINYSKLNLPPARHGVQGRGPHPAASPANPGGDNGVERRFGAQPWSPNFRFFRSAVLTQRLFGVVAELYIGVSLRTPPAVAPKSHRGLINHPRQYCS